MAVRQHPLLLTSTMALLSSLLLESAAMFHLGPFHVTSFAFRSLVLGPLLLSAMWLVLSRAIRAKKERLADCDVKHWDYAAEGALNVAVRYRGPNKELLGRVLRLRKKSRMTPIKSSSSLSSSLSVPDDDDNNGGLEDLEETLTEANEFVDRVMVPLLSRRFVPPSKVVKLDQLFIDELSRHIDSQRPAKRREAASLNRNAGVGLLMMDSAQIPCGCARQCPSLCFEIKPKWGFLSQETKDWDVKRHVDRFTMHQQMKRSSDPESEISEYCPIDLFHGGVEGIHLSLQRLARTPQNNLRLFVNGKLRFPSPSSAATAMLNSKLEDVLDNGEEMFQAIAEVLTKEDILSKLLKAQTIGPLNDIESVYPLYQEMVRVGGSIGDVHLGFDPAYTPQVPPDTVEDRAEIIKRFLISCTARDCSLMLTFSQCKCPTRSALGTCLQGRWNYELSVVDLDAKPISKMHHYFSVDREIAKTFTEYVARQSAM